MPSGVYHRRPYMKSCKFNGRYRDELRTAIRVWRAAGMSLRWIESAVNIHRATIHRILKEEAPQV